MFKAIERMAGVERAAAPLFGERDHRRHRCAGRSDRAARAHDGRIVNGLGADTDIIVASAKAYINALNRLHDSVQRLNPQLAA